MAVNMLFLNRFPVSSCREVLAISKGMMEMASGNDATMAAIALVRAVPLFSETPVSAMWAIGNKENFTNRMYVDRSSSGARP
mmetsp:Transcript_30164/g.28816  ORF Transcript_30164/g.28816 Transcript_30164/m.28816 type:complete len:82 (+) Transcript_30164:1253-1498(+)